MRNRTRRSDASRRSALADGLSAMPTCLWRKANCRLAEPLYAAVQKVSSPNNVSITDIPYIRTNEGWLHLGVVLGFLSRPVIR